MGFLKRRLKVFFVLYRSFDVPSMSSGFRARPVSTHRHAPPRKSMGPPGGAHKTAGVPSSPKRSSALLGRSSRGPHELPRVCRLSRARPRAPKRIARIGGGARGGGPGTPSHRAGELDHQVTFRIKAPGAEKWGPPQDSEKAKKSTPLCIGFGQFLPSAPTRDLGPQAPLIWALA